MKRVAPDRVVVVMPTWLGDCVMATPTLRAVRGLYPEAEVIGVIGRGVRGAMEGVAWVDRWVERCRDVPRGERCGSTWGILLPNSFRSACELWKLAGVGRRVGFGRDGRGFLLTDRLLPPRGEEGGFAPTPTVQYYLHIARYLGSKDPSPRLELCSTVAAESEADNLFQETGVADAMAGGRRLILIAAGANYGDAKIWFPERFAAVGAELIIGDHAVVAVTGTPRERGILDAVLAAAAGLGVKFVDLAAAGLSLAGLVAVVGRASAVVCNDSGTRHIAAAVGTPVVTVFGPTDPRRTLLTFEGDHHMVGRVPCHPCQQKKCPLTGTPDELICMRSVTAEAVAGVVGEVVGDDRRSLRP